jgi:hypothetical protein
MEHYKLDKRFWGLATDDLCCCTIATYKIANPLPEEWNSQKGDEEAACKICRTYLRFAILNRSTATTLPLFAVTQGKPLTQGAGLFRCEGWSRLKSFGAAVTDEGQEVVRQGLEGPLFLCILTAKLLQTKQCEHSMGGWLGRVVGQRCMLQMREQKMSD